MTYIIVIVVIAEDVGRYCFSNRFYITLMTLYIHGVMSMFIHKIKKKYSYKEQGMNLD